MGEQAEQRHLVRRFFRGAVVFVKWAFVVLLVLLLGAGIYFHAPWKVLLTFAIFLAAHTILPKRYRKKFWAVIGCIVVVLAVWVFLPEDSSDWESYATVSDEEIAALDAKRAVPDEENAAVIYNILFAEYGKFNAPDSDCSPNSSKASKDGMAKIEEEAPKAVIYPDFWNEELEDMTMEEPWSSNDHPELAEWFDGLEEAFSLLEQASEIDQCVFPILDIITGEINMDRLNIFKRWSQMLVRSINNDLGDNDVEGALNKTTILLKMAQHQLQQPTFIDLLVGIAIESLADRRLNYIAVECQLPDMQLKRVDELLTIIKHDWQSTFMNSLSYEYLYAKKDLCRVTYEANSKGEIRYNRDPDAEWRKFLEKYGIKMPKPSYLLRRRFKLNVIAKWFWVPSSPQVAGAIFDQVRKQRIDEAISNLDPDNKRTERIFLNFQFYVKAMTDRSMAPNSKIHELYMRVVSFQRVGRLMVGLRRYKDGHGSWPGGLAEIRELVDEESFVDPVNGGEYGYEVTDDGFAIYTKGENGIDEGGVMGRENEDGSKTDDYTFWPGKRGKNWGN